jgi:hypothetical protein
VDQLRLEQFAVLVNCEGESWTSLPMDHTVAKSALAIGLCSLLMFRLLMLPSCARVVHTLACTIQVVQCAEAGVCLQAFCYLAVKICDAKSGFHLFGSPAVMLKSVAVIALGSQIPHPFLNFLALSPERRRTLPMSSQFFSPPLILGGHLLLIKVTLEFW